MANISIERPFKRKNKFLSKIYENLGSPGRAIGIDFGSSGVKIIEIEKVKSSYRFVSFLFGELPAEARRNNDLIKEFYSNFIREAKSNRKITALDVFAVINSPQIASVFLDIPRVSSSDLASFVKTQTSKQIPFNPEQNQIFYRINRTVGREGKDARMKVVSLVVPNTLINNALDIIRANNLNIRGIFIASEAVGILPLVTEGRSKKDSYAVLDIGHKCSFLNIYRKGVLEFVRSINVAGEHITSSLLRTLTIEDKRIIITAEDAEKLKKECGFPLDEEKEEMVGEIKKSYIQTMLKPTIDRIVNELKRSLNYYSHFLGGEEIKYLYLTGGSSDLKNLQTYMRKTLGIEVYSIKPLKFLKGTDELSFLNQETLESFSGRFSSALGALIASPKRINVVPKSVLFEQKLNIFKIASAILVVLVGAMFFGFYFLTFGQIYNYQRLLKKVKLDYNKLAPVENAIDRYNSLKSRYNIKKRMILGAIGKHPRWGAVFKEFTNITPEGVVFNDMFLEEENGKKLRIKGEVFPLYTTVDVVFSQFITALAASPFFSDVKLISRKQDEYSMSPKIKFEIEMRLAY